MALKYLDQAQLGDRKVLCRFDFNVPLDEEQNILDTTRIDLALPTIRAILQQNPKKLIMMSHLGRPQGKPDPRLSLEPVASYLAQELEEDVTLSEAPVHSGVEKLMSVKSSRIILLENLRFDPGEKANDRRFAQVLASYGDVFVHDAFGAAHRKHASTFRIIEFFPRQAFGGLLLKKEVEALSRLVEKPAKPFYALCGGAKVADKIKVIERLLPQVNALFIGGAMAYPFLKARGHEIGRSLCSDEDVKLARTLLSGPNARKINLPRDHIVARSVDEAPQVVTGVDIPENAMGLDIGPETLQDYQRKIQDAQTVLWNGPLGFCEREDFAQGTTAMARFLAQLNAYTVVGGGDSVNAVNRAQVAQSISHISSGGGASLEFIEKGTLPGIQALKFGVLS